MKIETPLPFLISGTLAGLTAGLLKENFNLAVAFIPLAVHAVSSYVMDKSAKRNGLDGHVQLGYAAFIVGGLIPSIF
jgi:hypothetical protein